MKNLRNIYTPIHKKTPKIVSFRSFFMNEKELLFYLCLVDLKSIIFQTARVLSIMYCFREEFQLLYECSQGIVKQYFCSVQ